jgi:hypothetical protein
MAYNHLMKNGISRLESRVEQLVEGTFARLFAGRLHPREVALQLARAMEDNLVPMPSGPARAPQYYLVRLNPQDAHALLAAEPALAERLGEELIVLARDGGMVLTCRPEVTLLPDESLPAHSVAVEAGLESRVDQTSSNTPVGGRPAEPEPAPGAFLIVDGERHVTLNQAMYSIGRRRDNDIVVDDPRVSRLHAQVRQRYGRWVVFDLGSSRGTTVNGQPVTECVLQPGDVISLAGVSLIYGEDEVAPRPPASETGHTHPLGT